MNDIILEMTQWLHKQKNWRQEAAQRLLKNGALYDTDIQELVALLKTEEGQKVTNIRTFPELAHVTSGNLNIRLDSIGQIEGIENLAPEKDLCFSTGNLSVIYGNNGSGKSGYTRILKKLCGKPRAEELRHNVFQTPPDKRQCKVTYSIDGVAKNQIWLANSDPVEHLRSVDIFDGMAASSYLSDEKEATYTPRLILLFDELVQTCTKVKNVLKLEETLLIASYLPPMPIVFTTTSVAKTYQNLKADISPDHLSILTVWSDAEEKKLNALSERLKETNPTSLATLKRKQKTQIDTIIATLKSTTTALDTTACIEILRVKKLAQEKRNNVTEVAKRQLASAELDGLGTKTWNALWAAARKFSMEYSYKDTPFPKTDEDARCVLCHQLLDEDAQQRMQSFEKYVQSTIEAEAQESEKAYSEIIRLLPAIQLEQTLKTQVLATGLPPEAWEKLLLDFWQAATTVKEDIQLASTDDIAKGMIFPSDLIKTLQVESDKLEKEALQYDADAINFDYEGTKKIKLELEARRWCSQQVGAINKERIRLQTIGTLTIFKGLTQTRDISIQAGYFSEKLITEAFVKRFNEELEKLGAKHIKVELQKTRNAQGKTLHQIRLKGLITQCTADAVLSDGERRIVALAAFLADVTGNQQKAPFIFDDPISSLDQTYEQKVAKRLVLLAQERQVLVFTHRLSLCVAIDGIAGKYVNDWAKNNLKHLYIEIFRGIAGHSDSKPFWKIKPENGLNSLITDITSVKKRAAAGDTEFYALQLQGICSRFRQTIERTIEHDLLNKVVMRYRKSITTQDLMFKLAKIETSDCTLLDNLMTKYSVYEHDQSDEISDDLPHEDVILYDLNVLKTWIINFKKK